MSDEARLQRWLASHRGAAEMESSSDHIDLDTLTRHAAGQLSGAKARMVADHLARCTDRRCPKFVSSQTRGVPSRQRNFQARLMVWEQFETLARERRVS